MRRFALYSDIHGNDDALEAVLADIAPHGLTERYCLGDLVGYGPDPSAVIARVQATGDPVIRGNYDDGVGGRKGQCGCYYGTPEARADGDASYAWTDAASTTRSTRTSPAFATRLRFESEGVRVLLAHGSPRRINEYLMLDRPDWHLAKLAEEAEADVICFGHVHIPYHRAVKLESGRIVHFVSDGSVGKPKDGDTRACWAEVVIGSAEEVERARDDAAAERAGGAWVGVTFHRVAYDVESVAEAILAAGLPVRAGPQPFATRDGRAQGPRPRCCGRGPDKPEATSLGSGLPELSRIRVSRSLLALCPRLPLQERPSSRRRCRRLAPPQFRSSRCRRSSVRWPPQVRIGNFPSGVVVRR